MHCEIDEILKSRILDVIDLNTLNAKSELLNRGDKKYIVSRSDLNKIIPSLADNFSILEHLGKRIFRYESIYFDHDFLTYNMHHQGKRRRFKVRSRLYSDSGLCFFEMKVKKNRGNTEKRRIKYDLDSRFMITAEAQRFLENFYKEAYGGDFSWTFQPIITVRCDRITLAAKEGGERITIDLNIAFENHIGKYSTPNDFVILETKTSNGRGICDRILRSQGIRPQSSCSKYCLGIAAIGLVSKKNMFLDFMRKVEKKEQGTLVYYNEIDHTKQLSDRTIEELSV